MNLECQVCSFELSKELKELGVKQESYFSWVKLQDQKYHIWQTEKLNSRIYSAFTATELGEMLPPYIESDIYRLQFFKFENSYACDYQDKEGHCYSFVDSEAKTEADARAKMLIYLIKNHLIEKEKL